MSACILPLEDYRERQMLCLSCEWRWFAAEPEAPFDPDTYELLHCPQCKQQSGAYTQSLVICDPDEYCES